MWLSLPFRIGFGWVRQVREICVRETRAAARRCRGGSAAGLCTDGTDFELTAEKTTPVVLLGQVSVFLDDAPWT